jgi:nitrogen fixation NifU-like protein
MENRLQYAPLVAEYFDHPVNLADSGTVAAGAVAGEAGSIEQGAWVRIQAQLVDGRLQDVLFNAYGCPHLIAACCRVTEALCREMPDSLLEVDRGALMGSLQIPLEKAGKILILQDALHDCYQQIQPAGS